MMRRDSHSADSTRLNHLEFLRQSNGRIPGGILERFWGKVDRTSPHGCWLWLGGRNSAGYGVFGSGSETLAHRISYILVNGSIPEGLFACHRCDTPSCVRPDHLFVGTGADNMRDMICKGRHKSGLNWRPRSPIKSSPHVRIPWPRELLKRQPRPPSNYETFGLASAASRLSAILGKP